MSSILDPYISILMSQICIALGVPSTDPAEPLKSPPLLLLGELQVQCSARRQIGSAPLLELWRQLVPQAEQRLAVLVVILIREDAFVVVGIEKAGQDEHILLPFNDPVMDDVSAYLAVLAIR